LASLEEDEHHDLLSIVSCTVFLAFGACVLQKLAAAGYSLNQVLEMDDQMLRKAGVVVHGQRVKLLEEAAKARAQ